ncbi:NlpC/P60 family protein [Leucobacter sp. HNU]|uniref:NlpC/P60 family protein n=1 Tax=Leucobacter sp. HNU TaxID=3236805 RepID=UPI003A804BBB
MALCVGALVFAPATGAFADEAPQNPSPAVSAEAPQPQQVPQPEAPAPAEQPVAPAPAPAETPSAETPAPEPVPVPETPQPAPGEAAVTASVRILDAAKQTDARVAVVGSVLEAHDRTVAPEGVTPATTLAWLVDGTEVATGAQYTVRTEDLGKTITASADVAWPATDAFAAGSASAVSATGVPVKQTATASAVVKISGAAVIGKKLTAAASGVTAPTGVAPKATGYTWYADGKQIATGAAYTVKPADFQKRITASASLGWAESGAYVAGTLETAKSAATAKVVKQTATAVANMRVSGWAKPGRSLTAAATLKKPAGLAVKSSYTWYLNGKRYGGGMKLNVTPGMAGKRVTVIYRASWGDGTYASSATSTRASYTVQFDRPTAMVRSAYAQLGARQDCTALIERALRASGTRVGDLGTRAGEYAGVGGKRVSSLKPGDVMVWEGRHVAMYIGNGKAIHSGYAGNQTVVASAYLDGRPSSILRFA